MLAPHSASCVVGQLVDVGPGRQVRQGLLVGDHDVGRLHPGHVELVPAAQLAELDVGGSMPRSPSCFITSSTGSSASVISGEIAMQATQQAGIDAAGLGLGLDPGDPRPRLVDHVLDRLGKALEDDLADLLGLLDRPQLVREEDHVGARHASQRGGSDQRQAQRLHVGLPRSDHAALPGRACPAGACDARRTSSGCHSSATGGRSGSVIRVSRISARRRPASRIGWRIVVSGGSA